MKSSIIAALCCTLLLAALNSCSAYNAYNSTSSLLHNMEAGHRPVICTPRDKLISAQRFKIKGQYTRQLREIQTFATDGKARITAVKVLDQKTNGNNGNVTVVSGGPGMTYVTLEFKSQQGHGIDFIVEVYGMY